MEENARGWGLRRSWMICAILAALLVFAVPCGESNPQMELAPPVTTISLGQVWKLMFGLDNPSGRFINRIILALFGVAVLELGLATRRLIDNASCLRKAQRQLHERGVDVALPSALEDCLHALGLDDKQGQRSLVAQRIQNLFRLKVKGLIDVGVLKEITGERVSLHGGFSRFVAGSLVVIGLVGTVLGFSLTVHELSPQLVQATSDADTPGAVAAQMRRVATQMQRTLAGMDTAFSATLTGLICSIILSVLNFGVQRAQTGFYVRLESFSNYDLIPAIVPTPADRAAEEFARQLETAGGTISEGLTRVDTATQRYIDGAAAMGHAAAALAQTGESLGQDAGRMGSAAGVLGDASGKFIEAAQGIVEQNGRQTAQWAAVATQLQATTGALQGQVEQLASTGQALEAGTVALQAIRDLPASLQTMLEEAMQHAVGSAQQRQETLTTAYLERIQVFLEGVTSAQQAFQQRQVEQLAGTAQALEAGTVALQAIRDLPASLQTMLEEAMQHAVGSAQQRQETLTTAYLERIQAFLGDVTNSQQESQQLYADLVLGVQQSVAQLMNGSGGRQDEMLAELRTLTGKVSQDGIVLELRGLGTAFTAVQQGVAQLTNGSGQRQDTLATELQALNAHLRAVLHTWDGGSLRRHSEVAAPSAPRAPQGAVSSPAGRPEDVMPGLRPAAREPGPSGGADFGRHSEVAAPSAPRAPQGAVSSPAGRPEDVMPGARPAAREPGPSGREDQTGAPTPPSPAASRSRIWPFRRS